MKSDLLRPTEGRPVWIRVGSLFDGCKSVADAHLVYDASRIRHAGPELPAPEAVGAGRHSPDADLPDMTALPGLIEAHAHLFLEGGEERPDKRAASLALPPETLLRNARIRMEHLRHLGIVAVRDSGDKDGVGLALQKEQAFRQDWPWLDSPGAAIHHRGRYGKFMGRPVEDHSSPAECVASRVSQGAARIKLLATGIINFEKGAVTTPPQMSVGELSAFVEAARFHGRQTFAHCSGNEGVSNCIAAGVDSIEHGFFVDDSQLARMRDHNIAWVPTFAPVQFQMDHAGPLEWSPRVVANLQRILEGHAAGLAKAVQMGVCILAGSDAGSHGVPHGLGLLRELELMESAGMSAMRVLHAATGQAAGRLGFKEDFGRLRTGALSRFLLTRHSPFQKISNLRRAKTILFDGAVMECPEDYSPGGL